MLRKPCDVLDAKGQTCRINRPIALVLLWTRFSSSCGVQQGIGSLHEIFSHCQPTPKGEYSEKRVSPPMVLALLNASALLLHC